VHLKQTSKVWRRWSWRYALIINNNTRDNWIFSYLFILIIRIIIRIIIALKLDDKIIYMVIEMMMHQSWKELWNKTEAMHSESSNMNLRSVKNTARSRPASRKNGYLSISWYDNPLMIFSNTFFIIFKENFDKSTDDDLKSFSTQFVIIIMMQQVEWFLKDLRK
jgi:hypothetical protein